jgi:gliding motility-associated-like protein
MFRISLLTLFISILSFSNLFSQKGKDGAKTVSAANTKVNEFTALTTNASIGNTTLTVAASSLNTNARFTSTLTPGDLIMIIQMQGAFLKLWATPVWAPDSTYGQVYDYRSCGNYEFAEVKSIVSATQIEINCGLTHSYSSVGKTQIVRVPRYSSLNIAATGTLTTDAWNGTIGGILVAEVDGNTTINGVITTTGLGFRGGVAIGDPGSGDSSWRSYLTGNGAEKGEGIGSDTLTNSTSINEIGKQCMGAPANGGGGGNANNCGGGGGGNAGNILGWSGYGVANVAYSSIFNLEYAGRGAVVSSGGGKGGYGTSTTYTPNVTTVGPNTTLWGTFSRPSRGGFGGRPLDYSTGKIFLGGGGGAGHMSVGQSNGANACSGGAGGGLIYLLNYGTISGTGTISANGANGNNAFGTASISYPNQGIDGAGGAGAGGTIILNCNGTISSIIANANGGSGGNQNKSTPAYTETQGPGGGGGGGYIAGNGSAFTQNVNGGIYGTTNSTSSFTLFPMNGATSGNSGISGQVLTPSYSLTSSANQTLCTGQAATLTATSNNPIATILWYNVAAGGNSIASSTVYTTPTYTAAGTYTLFAGSCPGIYRQPIIITVNAGLSISINSPTICASQAVVLTATTSATSYTWNTGANTNSISVTPSVTTVYTINATSASCSGSKTTTVTVNSVPSLTVTNSTICAGSTTTLTATGATNYTWAPGGQTTSSIIVTPTVNTTYTITGANGTCTNTTNASVNITSTPTLVTSATTICAGQVATFTVSGAASYTWNPGSATGSTYTISPASSTTVSVLGANGSCTAQVTTSVTVNPTPTITVNSATICSNQTVTLTANGASTYTWNTGANTNSISVSPTVTTIYTINATSASCSSSKTTTVTISPQPTISVANASICSGSTATLIASGAINYTWMPGGQTTSSITVSPSVTTTYSITGSNGTCTNTTTATLSVTPTPTLTVNSVTICAGNTATLTASGATTYTWNPGSTSGSTYTIAPASSTTVSVVGANGSCTTQATASVTVGSSLSIAVNTATICAGQTTTLTASGAATYTWSTGANTNSISVSPSATTVYTVAGSTGGCNGINTTTVTVNANPTITVNSSSICSGQSATLTASGANTYTWSNGINTNTQTVSPASTTNYSVIGTNLAGCVSTTSVTSTVSVTPIPTLTVNPVTICTGNTATLTASGANTYTWNAGSGTGSSFTIAPASSTTVSLIGANGTCTSQTTSTVTVGSSLSLTVNTSTICAGQTTTLTASGAATYTWSTGANTNSISVSPSATSVYTLAGSNSGCNSNVYTTTVTVNIVPTLTVNSTAICSGQTATLNVTGANTYTWSNGVNANTQTVSPNTTTSYTVNGTALNGCDNITPSILTVSVTTTPTLIVNSPSVCIGNTATLTASSATTYTWNTGALTNSIIVTPSITTSYSVVGANGSCGSQTITSVTVDNAAISTYTFDFSICPSQTLNINSGSSPATSYTWSNGVNTSSQIVSPTATTIYTVIGTNINGCTVLTETVTVNLVTIVADFTGATNNEIVTVGSTLNLINTSIGADTYSWFDCNGGIYPVTNFSVTLNNPGTCCIWLYSTISASTTTCGSRISKCIDVVNVASINIPNVFTPNGDNINDVFKINSVGVKSLHCTIFDRWGLKLYEWTGLSGFWDGNTHSGIKTTTGTYFYVVEYTDMKDVTTNEKGFLSLFRE